MFGAGGNPFLLGYNLLLSAKGNYNNQTTNSQETLKFHQFSCSAPPGITARYG